MPNPKYYVFDDEKMIFEGMTKEQIINAIAEATGVTPQSIDEGFITTIVETNNNRSIHFWKGTKAQFEALTSVDPNTLYIVTDDTAVNDLMTDFEDIQQGFQDISNDVSDLKDKTYQIDDTGWLDWIDSGVTVGKYRVKNGIAYFDLDNFSAGNRMTVTVNLPIKLDPSGSEKIPLIYTPYNIGYNAYAPAIGSFVAEDDFTILSITATDYMDDVYGSFSYPVYDDDEE